MSTLPSPTEPLALLSTLEAPTRWFARASFTVHQWLQRLRARDELATLDDSMLKDIGVTRADVLWETDKHFWQP
ncbi:DUF1127 domain-containing protein [Ideonella sp. A 288]|uniref:DUF1127 domain-containing protein n=1 Tax=Ideonella sp. A 288 TaxID=1962181 RepID=UPI001185ED2D|nr:DUF1127 domain-containing protein [Ideonella sp. A 288]